MNGFNTRKPIMPRMTLRERILLGVIASCLTIAVLGPCEPTRIEARCAREVGVEWSVEEGVTEELEAFRDCVTERRG